MHLAMAQRRGQPQHRARRFCRKTAAPVRAPDPVAELNSLAAALDADAADDLGALAARQGDQEMRASRVLFARRDTRAPTCR